MNHIVYADLRAFAPHFDMLYRTASKARRERADRYREDAALQCLVSGALLAYAAGQAGIADFTVAENPFGKPHLENHPEFHFNVSHSGHYAAIAWGSGPVGIDLELLCHRDALPRLAARHFTAREQEYAKTTAGFYEIWTAKESYLKYLGTGINRPLNSFCTRSPELAKLLHTFFPEENCCLTVCSEGSCPEPIQVTAEDLLK